MVIYCLAATISVNCVSIVNWTSGRNPRTLNVGNALLEDLLEDLGVLELLLNLGDDRLSELLLLSLLDLALVSDPGVKDALGLGGQGGLLLELESLSLELGGFLTRSTISIHHLGSPTAISELPWKPQTGSW